MIPATLDEIRTVLLEEVPGDGSSVGNGRLRELIGARLQKLVVDDDYARVRNALVASGVLVKGQGRGGSVRRVAVADAPALTLEAQEVPAAAKVPKPKQTGLPLPNRKAGEPIGRARQADEAVKLIAYQHDQKRTNNPEVGMVTPESAPDDGKTRWAYDPHLDPALQFDSTRARFEKIIDDALASGNAEAMREALATLKRMADPYLNWAGKAERTSFEIDTVSLHVHERIDPSTILTAIRKRMDATRATKHGPAATQADFFRAWFENPLPYREAIEFYKHDRGWSNRLIAGDSLLVMNSLLQKEGMAGQVQMIYIDPPYGIKYGSNFQPFVNKRDVKDRSDADLTQEPEMIKAFRDTWELGIHSYLTYLRDRLLLARDLLSESGSVFVQISDENFHHVREICDEIFGADNFCTLITFLKTSAVSSPEARTNVLGDLSDYLIWYARDKKKVKYNQMYAAKAMGEGTEYTRIRDSDGRRRNLSPKERKNIQQFLDANCLLYRQDNIISTGFSNSLSEPISHFGAKFSPGATSHWKTTLSGMGQLSKAGRLEIRGSQVAYVRYHSDFPVTPIANLWDDTLPSSRSESKDYVVQTATKVLERCLLMTTDTGDLVLDPTCGSGTTAYAAERWGRRWITCDTSRVAVTLAKQRLMTASYEYFELKYPHEGLRGGFIYRTVPHVTLKSIANNPQLDEIYEHMHPAIEQALSALNTALLIASSPPYVVADGGRKGQTVHFAGGTTKGAPTALLEWEVPFDFPIVWPAAARAEFDAFHSARQSMQRRIDQAIASNADQETLYDQPTVSETKLRITGPFTVEAVPFPTVLSLDEQAPAQEADASIARAGESSRQHRWRDELLKTGIRGKGGQMLRFAELETLPSGEGYRHLHCAGHLSTGDRIVVSFGPEHAALEQRQVELAMREAGELFPRPKMIVYCAFAFDPEAAKDIDATRGITALKAQMNTDLLTEDLKKGRSSNQSFWLMGQPEVELRKVAAPKGTDPADDSGPWYQIEVHGFDYFDMSRTAADGTNGELVSGGKAKIAAWSLDTNYDDRSLFPTQVFFPMAGAKDGWHKLKKDIKAELNEALLDQLHGTVSLPFAAGSYRKVAVKIVDDRGIESLKVISLD